jgi:hypothetical protein
MAVPQIKDEHQTKTKNGISSRAFRASRKRGRRKTMKQFNISGPNDPARHYTLSALRRLGDVDVMELIERQSCFVLHAPPQTGKTTMMVSLARELKDSGRYTAALISMCAGAELKDDVGAAELAIVSDWLSTAASSLPDGMKTLDWSETPAGIRVGSFLREWATCIAW